MSIAFWPALQQLAGGTSGSPAPIVRDSQWTIVVVDTSTPGSEFVELPAGADDGDFVEILYQGGNSPQISAPSGESLVGGSPIPGPRFFRKIGVNLWGFVG